jgi:hypothetical protein
MQVRAADARLQTTQAELADFKMQIARQAEELNVARNQHASCEEEILRLQGLLDGGRDVERMTLEYRTEANERTILNLNQQLDFATKALQVRPNDPTR